MVGREGAAAWVAVRVALLPTTHRVRPLDFRFNTPRIVAAVVDNLDVQIDGRQVRSRANAVWPDGVDGLVDCLQNPARVLPVVVASRLPGGGTVIDVNRAAARLLGLAHVVVLEDASTAFRLTELVGKERSVYNGAVRVFYPGFTVTGDPFAHPLWLPSKIAEHHARGNFFDSFLLRRLSGLAAFRTPVPALHAAILERQAERRRGEFEELRTKVAGGQLATQALEDELLQALIAQEDMEKRLKEVSAELAAVQASFFQVAAAQGETMGPDEEVEPPPASPKTVGEAAARARDGAQYLVFHDEAMESASHCQYLQPEKILFALEALDEVAGRYQRKDSMPQGIEGALAESGLDYAPQVSQITEGKHKHEYQLTYRGKRESLGPHIKLGRGSPSTCARIYFFIDEELRIFVIGHVGHHLSDSKSG